MKTLIFATLFGLSLLGVVSQCQCAKSEFSPVWDNNQQQFKCLAPADSKEKIGDDSVSPKGGKEFCTNARNNLVQVCPASDEGKTCRTKAKTIFNDCYKDFKAQKDGQAGSPSTTNQGSTDRVVCMQTFAQQQQACNSRKIPPAAPGQPYVPDTCLQDALKAQDACLAHSR
jgi:hypothetical protein